MPYCDRCDRSFYSQNALAAHERDSPAHNVCYDCDRDFSTWTELKGHWLQSSRHTYCQYCDEHFDDDDDLNEHYEDSHYWCSDCRKVFKNEHGREQHCEQVHHYCAPCKRIFRSASNLQSHLNSSVHHPKDVICPLKGCGGAFVSNAALVLHFESGACGSGMDRRTLNKFVRQYDTNNVITDASRMLTNGDDDVNIYASAASWNGSSYECYLCHGTYRSLKALNQHLASPRHQDKIYICPLSTCRQRFTALSGLCQHIESERCGVSKFKQVQTIMNGVSRQLRIAAY